MKLGVVHISLMLAAVVTAQAVERVVSSELDDGGAGTLRTLTEASFDGDIIRIPSGFQITLTSEIVLNTKSLRFVGEGDGALISGDGLCRLFNITASGKPLEFYNICFADGHHSDKAGAIYVGNLATVVISNCSFNANSATANSGAIFIGSTVRIYDTVFDGNTSSNAGCYYVQGALTMERCTFINNAATGVGGVGHSSDSGVSATTLYRDCVFSNNIAGSSGCLYINWKAVFDGCEFISNTSASGPGGAVCNVPSGTIFSNCVFRDNIAKDGGALYLINNQATCIDCIFEGNSRTGGRYQDVVGGSTTGARFSGSGVMSNCVFRNNSANDGVISTFETSGYALYNCLFESNICTSSKGCIFAHWVSMSGCLFLSNQLVDASANQYLVRISGSSTPCEIVNCTFLGGSESSPISHARGAIAISSSECDASIAFSTFIGFRSDQAAIYTQNSDVSGTSLRGCAFHDNFTKSLSSPLDVGGIFANVENCFFSAAEGSFSVVSEGLNVFNLYAATAGPPLLLDPADNDGIVLSDGSVLRTCGIQSGSPLRNAGGIVTEPSTDARGKPRPDSFSGIADIGAFEYQYTPAGTVLFFE